VCKLNVIPTMVTVNVNLYAVGELVMEMEVILFSICQFFICN
jgi:hypothetical protein